MNKIIQIVKIFSLIRISLRRFFVAFVGHFAFFVDCAMDLGVSPMYSVASPDFFVVFFSISMGSRIRRAFFCIPRVYLCMCLSFI